MVAGDVVGEAEAGRDTERVAVRELLSALTGCKAR